MAVKSKILMIGKFIIKHDFESVCKIRKPEKIILKNLRYLYKKYVYNPAKQAQKLTEQPTSPKSVKKTIAK